MIPPLVISTILLLVGLFFVVDFSSGERSIGPVIVMAIFSLWQLAKVAVLGYALYLIGRGPSQMGPTEADL